MSKMLYSIVFIWLAVMIIAIFDMFLFHKEILIVDIIFITASFIIVIFTSAEIMDK